MPSGRLIHCGLPDVSATGASELEAAAVSATGSAELGAAALEAPGNSSSHSGESSGDVGALVQGSHLAIPGFTNFQIFMRT